MGYRPGHIHSPPYSGPLYNYAPFDISQSFDEPKNKSAFRKQVELVERFLRGVRKNTADGNPLTDPWTNMIDYALLKPTGINALFLVLAKMLKKHSTGGLDFGVALKPLASVSFSRDFVSKKGGGWKGFRNFANHMLRKLNSGRPRSQKYSLYGKKGKQ